MSMVNAGVVAAAIAAAEQERMRQEEEEMTPYSDRELAEGWEFKILRATSSAFRNPEQLRAVLEEEKKGGWVLVEKFDDARIRLKRPAGMKPREADFADGYDPYRTVVGIGAQQRALLVMAIAGSALLIFIITVAALGAR